MEEQETEVRKETTKIRYNPTNKHKESDKPIQIRKGAKTLHLCKMPDGAYRYLTDAEYPIIKEVDKAVNEGRLTTVVSPAALNDLFKKDFYRAEDDPYLKWIAKMYYKQYFLDFDKYNNDRQRSKRTAKLQELGESYE